MNHAQLPPWDDKSIDQKLDALRGMVDDLYRFQLGPVLSSIQRQLDSHIPADEKEAKDLVIMKQMVRTHTNILSPMCEPGHLTGSALVIDEQTGRIVLHYHKRLNRWLQFGGHADAEIDMSLVAMREAQEESGLPDLRFYPDAHEARLVDVDVHTIPQNGDFPEHLHLDFRYLLATSSPHRMKPQQDEVDQFQWVTFEAAQRMSHALDASLLRLIRKAHNIYNSASYA